MVPKLDPKELEYIEVPGFMGMKTKSLNYPLNKHDHEVATFRREPWWQAMQATDAQIFTPSVIPDNVARGFVFEAKPFNANEQGGGPDMFGVEWEYIKTVGGSMVRPGNPYMEDISEWREKVVWPDLDSWDWEGSAKLNNGTFLKKENFNQMWFQTGFFERLIAFMEFEGAIMALFDEDSQPEVHAFFDKLTDFYIEIFKRVIKYFPDVNAVFFHDDWGSQKETFFSPSIVEEMTVPYMKKVTDHIHSIGRVAELHSCGQIFKQVPNIIAAGWDTWSGQAMNDTHKIYELYGDRLVVGVIPEQYDASALSEEEQRAKAREFAEKFCDPDKPCVINPYGASALTLPYREELYKQSRIRFGK